MKYLPIKSIVFRDERPEGGILGNSETIAVISINSFGVRIWELLRENNDEDTIANVLLKEYEVDDKQVLIQDVREFLTYLNQTGFIVIKDEAG